MRLSALLAPALTLVVAMGSVAQAGEPRPWLCRDKPVFSSPQPMTYRLSTSSRVPWQMLLMQFSPGSGHDGFDITNTMRGNSSGSLRAGRYFAVALRLAGGNWVCPAEVNEEDATAGTISSICFAAREGGCDVKFVVTPDRSSPQSVTP